MFKVQVHIPQTLRRGGGFNFTAGSYITYYISKNENNILVTSLGIGNTYSKKLKKTVDEFFNSFPDLLEKN